jgi:hypothetical protein
MVHTSPDSTRPPLWKVWWVACRPHTLTAALSPVLVAYNAGLSVIEDVDKGSYLCLTLQWAAFCMLVQVGSSTEKSQCRRLLKILTYSPICAAWNKLAQRLCRLCESKFLLTYDFNLCFGLLFFIPFSSTGRRHREARRSSSSNAKRMAHSISDCSSGHFYSWVGSHARNRFYWPCPKQL